MSEIKMEHLRHRLARAPNDGDAWLEVAQILSQGPPGEELFHAIEQSIKSLPENDQAWFLAGTVHQREHGTGAALRWLETMIRQNLQLAAPRLVLASLLAPEHPEVALKIHAEVIAAFPQDARAHVLAADLQQNLGMFKTAVQHMRQALKIEPDSAEYWARLASIQFNQGALDPAVEAADHSIELDGEQMLARLVRGDVHRQFGAWEKAFSDYRKVEKAQGRNAVLLNNIGSCLAGMEQFDSAAEYFHQALQIDPELDEAKLNIALLAASRLETDEAISRISEVLNGPSMNPQSRLSAQITLDILTDHQRLKPFLQRTQKSTGISELQLALEQTPPALLNPNQATLDTLSDIAALCRQTSIDVPGFSYHTDTRHLLFVEACTQCKLAGDPADMAQAYMTLNRDSTHHKLSKSWREVLNVWRLNRQRQNHNANLLQQRNNEAWLKYWQAGLLRECPEKQPGQYKAISNTIGNQPLTPPGQVAGTFRTLLAEIRPTVPEGLARGVFMYTAICRIHGFVDGNGRLARFILNWELESQGLPAITIPLKLRTQAAQSLNASWYSNNIAPSFTIIETAYLETDRLLRQFNEALS